MKKIDTLMLVALIAVLLVACGNKKQVSTNEIEVNKQSVSKSGIESHKKSVSKNGIEEGRYRHVDLDLTPVKISMDNYIDVEDGVVYSVGLEYKIDPDKKIIGEGDTELEYNYEDGILTLISKMYNKEITYVLEGSAKSKKLLEEGAMVE